MNFKTLNIALLIALGLAVAGIVGTSITATTLNNDLAQTKQDLADTKAELDEAYDQRDEAIKEAEGLQDALDTCAAQNEEAIDVANVFYDIIVYIAGGSYGPPSDREVSDAVDTYETLDVCGE